MAVEDDDDRAAFVDPDEFGAIVTWTRAGVLQPAFNAILSRPSVLTMPGGDGVELIDRAASLNCREIDVPSGAAENDPVAVVDGTGTHAFRCKLIRPDGTGFVTVDLKN